MEFRSKFCPTENKVRSRNHQKLQSSMWWRSGVEDSTLLPQFVCERMIEKFSLCTRETTSSEGRHQEGFLNSKTEEHLLWWEIRCWERCSSLNSKCTPEWNESPLEFWIRGDCSPFELASAVLRTASVLFVDDRLGESRRQGAISGPPTQKQL